MNTIGLIRLTALALVVASGAATSLRPSSFHNKVSSDESVVVTDLGTIQGEVLANSRRFRSIPYAEPPVNTLRWRPPKEVAPWAPQTLKALNDPPGCVQICALPPHTCPATTTEDCLFLNVFTPRVANIQAPIPVLFFIHGGNFRQGYGGGLLYDGSNLAAVTNSVVVTINYRLGAMGFLYTGSGASSSIDGNYGILDQRMAMKWVKQHIGAFGGDPTKVTIFGQSAGSQSVATHLLSPGSAEYFRAAMMLSEPFGLPFRTPSQGISWAKTIASKGNCQKSSSTIEQIEECLRNLSADDVLAAQHAAQKDLLVNWDHLLFIFNPWGPIANSTVLADQPLYLFKSGKNLQTKPIITGTVKNEGWMFVYEAFPKAIPSWMFDLLLPAIFGGSGAQALKTMYPVPASMTNDTRPILAKLATEGLFVCPGRHGIQAVANRSLQSVWLYRFDHLMSFSDAVWGPNFTMCDDKICHGADLPFWFKPDAQALGIKYQPDESTLAQQMGLYAGNFASALEPNSGNGPTLSWPTYSTNSNGPIAANSNMIFNTPANGIDADPYANICDKWDSEVGYDFITRSTI